MPDPITFINVVEVDPSKHQEVLDLLREGAEEVMVKRPGFRSLTLLASLDGTRIVNIAEWESAEDVKATQQDSEAADYAKRTAALAKATPGLFTIAGEYSAETGTTPLS